MCERAWGTGNLSIPTAPPRRAKPGPPCVFEGFILDLDASTLARESGEAIPLTRGELALLRFFVSHPGRVLSRDLLLDATAGRRFEPFDRSIDVMVGRLRRKIERAPKAPRLIVTVQGGGYQFAAALRKAGPTASPAVNAAKLDAPTPLSAPALAYADPSRPAAAQSTSAERRPVTVMFCDLVGSMGLAATLDPEDWRDLVKTYLDEASKAVTGLGGHVLTRLSNGLMASSAIPKRRRTTPSGRCALRSPSSARSRHSTPATKAGARQSLLHASASTRGRWS